MADTIPARLFGNAERRPSAPAYFEKVDGEYRPTSWAAYADQVRTAGKALMALGVEPGGHVTILGFNRPEWVIADLACMAIGGAPGGIYTTNSAEEIAYINRHSGAPVAFVEDHQRLGDVLAGRAEVLALRTIVLMRGAEPVDDPMVITWDEFMARGAEVPDSEFAERLDALEPDGLATLIYTSGTTGPPKGVMLSHSNLTWTADQGIGVFGVTDAERLVSYLPLSHIAEQMFTLHIAITVGYPVYFAESIVNLADDIKAVRPTVFFAVPRVWEKFHTGVFGELSKAKGVKAALARWAQRAMREAVLAGNRGRRLSGLRGLQARLADRLVGAKVREAIGMGDVRLTISGAAPISPEVLEFFAGFGLSIMEVYGLSETTGPATFNQPGRTRFGTVGPAYPGTDVEIAPDGEILVRGGNVFTGYYKNPEKTAEALVGGWLHTGDLGGFDDGFLEITGRKKDIIVTSGGKNIAPQNLESGLKEHLLIGEAVVIGDRRKYLTALVCLNTEAAEAWAAEEGIPAPLHTAPEIVAEVQRAVDAVNESHSRVGQIKRFTILPREFSVEEGELTGTLKVRRNVVADHFSAEIEAMYV